MSTYMIGHSVLLIVLAMCVTIILRALPFVMFSGKKQMPQRLKAVTEAIPPAIIAILVVYCIKDSIVAHGSNLIASLVAIALVVLLHLYKRNICISIVTGTLVYMILIRLF